MIEMTDPACAICGAPVHFDSPNGKAPAWAVLCCGGAACRAQINADEASVEAEYARRERCHGDSAACPSSHGA